MSLELIVLGGYGQFVWPAFIFSFVSCLYLYLKTKKELKEQEKIFLDEFKQFRGIIVEALPKKEYTKKALSGNLV